MLKAKTALIIGILFASPPFFQAEARHRLIPTNQSKSNSKEKSKDCVCEIVQGGNGELVLPISEKKQCSELDNRKISMTMIADKDLFIKVNNCKPL